jgi:poly(3-hydroxybutyrate) depolymerase
MAASPATAAEGDVPTAVLTRNVGHIVLKSWLVGGMFPSTALPQSQGGGYGWRTTDYLAPLGGEQTARLRAGAKVPLAGGGEVTFTPRTWDEDYTNLVQVFGSPADVCAYLYSEVESPVAQDVYFHIGTNDGGKLWVGNELVIDDPQDHTATRSLHAKKVRLPAGRTRVLVKIDQRGGNWGAYVELYGKREHDRLVKLVNPDTLRAAKRQIEQLRREIGDPFAANRARLDAYTMALYWFERVEKVIPEETGANGQWNPQQLTVALYLNNMRSAIRTARAGTDPHAGRTGLFEAAYLSKADDTAQPFTICIPESYDPSRKYNLALELHGAGGTHETVGTWWGINGPADSTYFDNTIGVSVMGRGRYSGYQALGENDVLEVIKWVSERYSIDADRVYIGGGSMGGGGSWRMAALYPDRFAAAWPDMGWAITHAQANTLNLPLYINHGVEDWTVAITASRLGVKQLQRYGSPYVYTEWPGVAHAVAGPARREGYMTRMGVHTRVTDPAHIRIHADHPRYATMYWGAIEEWDDPHALARLEAHVIGRGVISVTLENVRRARLSPPIRHLGPGREIVWLAGGKRVTTRRSPNGVYDIAVTDSTVSIAAHVDRPEPAVRSYAPGASTNFYNGEPFMIVYGTQSHDDSLKKAIRRFASAVSRRLSPTDELEFGRVPMVADRDLTAQQIASKNLILIGGAQDNSVAARLMPQMPVREEQGALRVFDEAPVSLEGRGYGFVNPNPEAPKRLVLVYSSSVKQFYAERVGFMFDWRVADSAPYVPDLVVETVAPVDSMNDMRQNRIVRQRMFTHGWKIKQVSDGQITHHAANIREQAEMRARAYLKATGMDFAAGVTAGGSYGDLPPGYLPETFTWQDHLDPRHFGVTFDLTGAEIVRFAGQDMLFYPQVDSTKIVPEKVYRVVGEGWIMWPFARQFQHNLVNPEELDLSDAVNRHLREEYGVRER